MKTFLLRKGSVGFPCAFKFSSSFRRALMVEKSEKTVKCLFRMGGKAKSSKSHKTPASSSSSSSTTPSMTSSSLPVSTQAPVTSSHHSTSASSTPNSQTNVVRYERECTRSLNRWFFSRFHYFFFSFFLSFFFQLTPRVRSALTVSH